MCGMKVYSVEELRKCKPGTVFEHLSLGRCMVKRNRKAGWNYMVFKYGHVDTWFLNDELPWTIPMKLIEV